MKPPPGKAGTVSSSLSVVRKVGEVSCCWLRGSSAAIATPAAETFGRDHLAATRLRLNIVENAAHAYCGARASRESLGGSGLRLGPVVAEVSNSFPHACFHRSISTVAQTSGNHPPFPMAEASFHIIAHRGWRSECPENTLAAFTGAIHHGFPHFEADAQVTQDGICVIFHDETVNRTTGSSGQLALVRLCLAARSLAKNIPGCSFPSHSVFGFHLWILHTSHLATHVFYMFYLVSFACMQMQYADVQELDAGSWFSQGFAGGCTTVLF